MLARDGQLLLHRDLIRAGLDNPIEEGTLTLLLADMARSLLERDCNVLAVAQNLHADDRALWQDVAAEGRAELSWLDTRDPAVHPLIPPLEGWWPSTW